MADDMKLKGLEPGCSYCGAFCPRCTSKRPAPPDEKLAARLREDARRRWRREAASSGRQCEAAAQWTRFCRLLERVLMDAGLFELQHGNDAWWRSLNALRIRLKRTGRWSGLARAVLQGGWEVGPIACEPTNGVIDWWKSRHQMLARAPTGLTRMSHQAFGRVPERRDVRNEFP